jgi:RNA polymerase sigma-70 factor (ECF subfamily)
LLKAARRKAIDRIRRDRGFAAKLLELAYLYELENNSDDVENNAVIPDERLQIIFICYHSVLAEKSRVALTLRALGVLSKSQLLFWTQMKRCSGGSRVRKRKLWEQRSPIRYQT